jgi:hypothetical protein
VEAKGRRKSRHLTRTAPIRVVGLLALGGIAALSGLAACGVAPSGADTAVATSVSFSLDLQVEESATETTHLLAQGQMNFVQHSVAAVVTVPRASTGSSASDAEVGPGKDTLQLHTEWVDDQAYMTVPSAWSALAGDAPTVSIPTSPTMVRSIDTALTQSAVSVTYAKILLGELTAHATVHRLPGRTIGGVRVTGTRVDLTLTQLLKVVPELAPTLAKKGAAMAHASIPVTVWVDSQGRLIEVVMAPAGGAPSVQGTVRFSHYGAPATVTAPPAGTVKPIPAALGRVLHASIPF